MRTFLLRFLARFGWTLLDGEEVDDRSFLGYDAWRNQLETASAGRNDAIARLNAARDRFDALRSPDVRPARLG